MTPEKKTKQAQKRQDRKGRNLIGKILRAEQRQKALIELGRTVIEVETKDEEGNVTKHYDFPPTPRVRGRSISSLYHINAKTSKASGIPRKNRPSFQVEQAQAIVEDASRSLAKAIDKALAPESEDKIIPAGTVIPTHRLDPDVLPPTPGVAQQ